MATLTGLPSSIIVGNTSGTVTLSTSSLITEMSITDSYWSVSSNWKYCVFQYGSPTGGESYCMSFPISTDTSTFGVSLTARTGSWTVSNIIIFDNDHGTYIIPRASFPTPAEFDITVLPTVPPLVSPQFHFDPSKANGGTTHYTDGTEAASTVWTEVVAANNGTFTNVTGKGTWKGAGTGANPYRINYNSHSALALNLATPIAAGGSYQHIQFWGNLTIDGTDTDIGADNTSTYVYTYFHSGLTGFQKQPNSHTVATGLASGAWHLYTFTRDSSGNNAVYVDGTQVISFTDANITPSHIDAILGIQGFGFSPFGDIGDVWTFNTALTGTDITNYYNQTKATYGL